MSKRNLKFSHFAEREIQEISDYTLSQFGKQQVRKYIGGLFREIDRRATEPLDGARSEIELAHRLELPIESVRSFLYGKHRCYFYFTDKALRVLSVLHSARDVQNAFERIAKKDN